jgi:hypothetical protein
MIANESGCRATSGEMLCIGRVHVGNETPNADTNAEPKPADCTAYAMGDHPSHLNLPQAESVPQGLKRCGKK